MRHASYERLSIGEGVMVELDQIDSASTGFVELLLFWPPPEAVWPLPPPGEPLDGYEATVRWSPSGPVIQLAVYGPHSADCGCDNDQQETQLRVWVEIASVERYVDVLRGMPRERICSAAGGTDALFWRGRRTGTGRAVIERIELTEARLPGGRWDGRADDRAFAVVGVADVSLPPPPAELAVPADGGIDVLRTGVAHKLRDDNIFDLPRATPVGRQSMSAIGGGGGMVRCISTTWPLEEVVRAVSRTLGAPEEASPTSAAWRHTTENGWGRATSFADAWTVGHGSAPGFDPSLVPPDARSVLAEGSAATPHAEKSQLRPKRWWRR